MPPRQEPGPPLASDERFLAQTYRHQSLWANGTDLTVTLDSHMIFDFQRVSAVWRKGRDEKR